MNYNNYLNEVSYRFVDLIKACKEVECIPTEDFGWTNIRFKSPIFRMAHVERYTDRNMEVLHVTTFPYEWSPEPIFGFDIITSKKTPLGCYMDLSPGILSYEFDDISTIERKPLPEWACVFSDRFILTKPENEQEVSLICDWSLSKYKWYLNQVLNLKRETNNQEEVISLQNKYCDVQASNPRTKSALTVKIGLERAEYFMNNILFPKIV